MRLQQYLNEGTWSYNDMVSLIKANCKPFLKDWQSTYRYSFLYSGREWFNDFDMRAVRKDRNPQSTPSDIHEWIDDWFYKKFGVRARSNVVFGTFNKNDAENYGEPFMIFPIDKYMMLSSNKVEDLYLTLGKYLRRYDRKFEMITYEFRLRAGDINIDEVKTRIIDFLNKSNYKKNILNLNEQMVICKKYYMIQINYQKELKEDLLN